MISIDVRHDVDRLIARYELLAKDRAAAAVRTLNRSLTTVRAEGARKMREQYALPISTLKKQIRFTRATRVTLTATLTFSGKRFRLANWKAVQTKLGVRVRGPWALETGDGCKLTLEQLRNAFIQSPRGVRNVWIRAGRSRYPIEVLVAPSLSRTFVEKQVGNALGRLARERFLIVFEQEARFRLSKG